VTYGIVGLKTHTKIALVVRRENEDFRFYAHIGTGNYNSDTAKLYTDMGLLTSDMKITSELIEIFNYLTGLSLNKNYKKFLVAPINMRERFMEMIHKEIENHQKGKPSHIIAKMNSLEDQACIEALYEASNVGVPIDLFVRGLCCLVPGVPGRSENIRVYSIIGRFLEHSRIFYFRNGATHPESGKLYIGSADWMYRNLNNRVESIIPLESKSARKKCWEVLQVLLADKKQAWKLKPDGTYDKPTQYTDEEASGTHETLMRSIKPYLPNEKEIRLNK